MLFVDHSPSSLRRTHSLCWSKRKRGRGCDEAEKKIFGRRIRKIKRRLVLPAVEMPRQEEEEEEEEGKQRLRKKD